MTSNPTRDEVERLADRMEMSARVSSASYDTCQAMDKAANMLRALREKLEAAEASEAERHQSVKAFQKIANDAADVMQRAVTQRDEARAQAAAGFMAGRDAGERDTHSAYDRASKGWAPADKSTPPSDHTAALNALLDAEWNKAIEAAAYKCHADQGRFDSPDRIRALRRTPKEDK